MRHCHEALHHFCVLRTWHGCVKRAPRDFLSTAGEKAPNLCIPPCHLSGCGVCGGCKCSPSGGMPTKCPTDKHLGADLAALAPDAPHRSHTPSDPSLARLAGPDFEARVVSSNHPKTASRDQDAPTRIRSCMDLGERCSCRRGGPRRPSPQQNKYSRIRSLTHRNLAHIPLCSSNLAQIGPLIPYLVVKISKNRSGFTGGVAMYYDIGLTLKSV